MSAGPHYLVEPEHSEALRARHAEVLADLEELRKECLEANSDGYDALPLSEESARLAARAIDSIILGFRLPSPSLGSEPDGAVTLAWCGTPGHELSVSVSPSGAYNFSTVMGEDRIYGRLAITDEFPGYLRALIREVVACEEDPARGTRGPSGVRASLHRAGRGSGSPSPESREHRRMGRREGTSEEASRDRPLRPGDLLRGSIRSLILDPSRNHGVRDSWTLAC